MGTIVDLATSVVIDTNETLTVDKVLLASKIGALGDTYFNNQSNWSSIEVEYRSTTGNQREIVKIDVAGSTGNFAVSTTARVEGWSLRSIRVKDSDGDSFTVKRADLVGTEYNDTTISDGAPAYPFIADMSLGGTFGTYDLAKSIGLGFPGTIVPDCTKLVFPDLVSPAFSTGIFDASTGDHYIFSADSFSAITPGIITVEVVVDNIDSFDKVILRTRIENIDNSQFLYSEPSQSWEGASLNNTAGSAFTMSVDTTGFTNIGDIIIFVDQPTSVGVAGFAITSIKVNV